jgi:hypothetical protein
VGARFPALLPFFVFYGGCRSDEKNRRFINRSLAGIGQR